VLLVHWHHLESPASILGRAEGIVHHDRPARSSLTVPCLHTSLTLDEIYEGVDLPRVSEPELLEYGE